VQLLTRMSRCCVRRFACIGLVGACCQGFSVVLPLLAPSLQSRVLHGVRQEILALSEIPFVKSHTARLLYKAGLRTPDAVAAVTSVDQIVAILSAGAPPGCNTQKLWRVQAAPLQYVIGSSHTECYWPGADIWVPLARSSFSILSGKSCLGRCRQQAVTCHTAKLSH